MINPEDGPMTVPGCKSNLVRENQADVVSRLKQQVEIRGTASPFGMLAADALKFIQQQAEQIAELRNQLLAVNSASHSLAASLCGVHDVATKDGYELIRRDSVMELVTRWRSQWDAALAKPMPMPKAMKEDS
jgi:hypothetical protein